LQEQKLKQEEEFQEKRKLGNLIREVNEDEYEYLLNMERELDEKERLQSLQDQQEVKHFKEQVKQLEEKCFLQQEEEEPESFIKNETFPNKEGNESTLTLSSFPLSHLKGIRLVMKSKESVPSLDDKSTIPLQNNSPFMSNSLVDYEESDEDSV
jgi:hypothetical protein